MIIGWLTGKDNWAYLNLALHKIKAMPQHNHVLNNIVKYKQMVDNDLTAKDTSPEFFFDCKPNTIVIFTPESFDRITSNDKIILHLNSPRSLKDKVINENIT